MKTFKDPSQLILLVGTALLYVATRPTSLASDGATWIQTILDHNIQESLYGTLGHFLQIPLVVGLLKIFSFLHINISAEFLFLFLSLLGVLLSVWSFRQWLLKVFNDEVLAGLGALLLVTSVGLWFFWNGELIVFGLGFALLSLLKLQERKVFSAALCWGLSVCAHSEFVFYAPLYFYILWNLEKKRPLACVRSSLSMGGIAVAVFLIIVLGGGWLLGKWIDFSTLREWIYNSHGRHATGFEDWSPVKGIKGMLTSLNVTSHFLSDAFKGRLSADHRGLEILGVLLGLGFFSLWGWAVWKGRKHALIGVATIWILPIEILFNWRYCPNWEEYHVPVVPALVFAGVVGSCYAKRPYRFLSVLVGLSFITQLFFLFLPSLRYDQRQKEALSNLYTYKMSFLKKPYAVLFCGEEGNYFRDAAAFFSVKEVPVQEKIEAWIEDQRDRSVLALADKCDFTFFSPEYKALAEKIPFSTIWKKYGFSDTGIFLPLNRFSQTHVFSWREGRVLALIQK